MIDPVEGLLGLVGTRVHTLGEIKAANHALRFHCPACNRCPLADIDNLIERFGVDCDLVDNRAAILKRAKCAECGNVAGSLTLHPPT